MTTLLSPCVRSVRPASTRSALAASLTLERTEIEFHSPNAKEVTIRVTLSNFDDRPSSPALLRFQTAPLGAFVNWRPLAEVLVEAVEPGGRHVVSFNVERSRRLALYDAGRLPPSRLLTALDMGEPEPSPVRRSLLRSSSGSKGRNIGFQTGALAADLVELLGHGNPHWAGNLNVFVGTHAVERHLARALRIYSGRTNLACFMVGSGRDAYSFRLAGRGAEWDAQLVDPMRSNTPIRRMFDADPTDRVVEDHWIEVTSRHIMFLVIRAPASCDQGEVEVHVTQRSTGRTAVVEFSMDTHAAGPGCFVVS